MTAFACLSLAICLLLGMQISGATQPHLRIVGGNSVTAKFRYPYMVSITNSKGSHICGGVLIRSNVVISAAHCVPNAYSVHIGRYDLNVLNGDKRWDYEVLKIEEKIIHPLYDDETNLGDLVIFQLESSSELGTIVTMQNSTTISQSSDILGTNLTVIGWGATKVNGEMSDRLQEVVVNQVSNTQCNSMFGGRDRIKPSMICASLPGQDACQGDSGGPLLHLGDDLQGEDDIVVGLVSFGIGCAHPNYPGVYTRVESYFDWIMRTMEDIEVPADLMTEENQSRNPDGFLSSPGVWRWVLAGI
eukprot:scaffold908_cov47-Attheya_sp.AAC.2